MRYMDQQGQQAPNYTEHCMSDTKSFTKALPTHTQPPQQ